jgi:hypothetical protein
MYAKYLYKKLFCLQMDRADQMAWDDVNNWPISIKEMDLDELLEDEDVDWTASPGSQERPCQALPHR